jgi:hypothetical protein
LATLSKTWRYHHVTSTELVEHKRYAGKGRPSAKSPLKALAWQICTEVCPDAEAIRRQKQHKGHVGGLTSALCWAPTLMLKTGYVWNSCNLFHALVFCHILTIKTIG